MAADTRLKASPRSALAGVALTLLALTPGACAREDDARTDEATAADGLYARIGAPPAATSVASVGASDLQVVPQIAEIQQYLDGGDAVGRRFALPFVHFSGGQDLREEPNGSLASLAAVLADHPQARARVEVLHPNPLQDGPSGEAQTRAQAVADYLVRNGAGADQISSAGVQGGKEQDVSSAYIVITRK